MENLKIIMLYEKIPDSMDDKQCNKFIDFLHTVIENSIWKDIVTTDPE